jgi:hypothetical protein
MVGGRIVGVDQQGDVLFRIAAISDTKVGHQAIPRL